MPQRGRGEARRFAASTTKRRRAARPVNAVTLLTAQALGEGFKLNALAPGLRATSLIPGMAGGGDPAEAAAGAVQSCRS